MHDPHKASIMKKNDTRNFDCQNQRKRLRPLRWLSQPKKKKLEKRDKILPLEFYCEW